MLSHIDYCKELLKIFVIRLFSAFKFKSYMTSINRVIRKGDKPLQQIGRRYSVREALQKKSLVQKEYILEQEHNSGPLTTDYWFVNYINE